MKKLKERKIIERKLNSPKKYPFYFKVTKIFNSHVCGYGVYRPDKSFFIPRAKFVSIYDVSPVTTTTEATATDQAYKLAMGLLTKGNIVNPRMRFAQK